MVNRITQSIISRNLLNQIQARQSDLFSSQHQASSGLRYDQASEDPLAASVALDVNQALSFQKRLISNAQTAQDFNNFSENELSSAEEVLQRVRELAINAANEALNAQQIDGMSTELSGLLNRMLDLANGTHEGRYLFGGYQTQRPPFEIEKNLTISGSALTDLGLNAGDYRTRVETHSITTAQAGAFSLNGGDIILNGVDLGTFVVNDPSRTAADNAQTLVERINRLRDQTGVTAKAITLPGGTYDTPGGGPLEGIALVNLDENGNPTTEGINVAGKGFKGVGGVPIFRQEDLPPGYTRFTSEQIGSGAIGDVPAGTLSVNGFSVNSAMTFAAGNSAEQNAQEIARAINTVSDQSQVFAKTDGYGYVQLYSQNVFEITGAPAQLQLPNQIYTQTRDGVASTGPVASGSALSLGEGSLILNGVDIFSEGVPLTAGMSVQTRADVVVRSINSHTNESGISARHDASGQIYFSNLGFQITGAHYRGDAGDNQTQIGNTNLVPLYMSGDEAFAGNRNASVLVSAFDLPAAGLGSAVSSANVSFAAGDSLAAGDFQINGTDILTGPLTGAAAADATTVISAINAQTATTGVSASLSGAAGIQLASVNGTLFNVQVSGTGTRTQLSNGDYLNGLGAGDFQINGVDIGPIPAVPANPSNPIQNALDLAQTLADAINAQAGNTGVQADVQSNTTGGVRLLLNAAGQNIEISTANPVPATLLNATGFSAGTVVSQQINVFDAIKNLRDQVINSKHSRSPVITISNQNLKEVSDALDVMVTNRDELGLRSQRAQLVQQRSSLNQEILTQQLSENRDTDLTEVISRMNQQETALQAAYAITQRSNNLSLLKYI